MMKAKSPEQFPALRPAQSRAPFMGGSAAAGSGSYRSYADVASGRASSLLGSVSPYLAMVVDPMAKDKAARYPDETIVPTGMVHFNYQTTYVVSGTGPNPNTFAASLRWKCAKDDPATFADTSPIALPGQAGVGAGWTDYGVPQTNWAGLSAIDRTLAAGIRVRVVALPTATYLPSGTLYFIQVQASEVIGAYGSEAVCIQAVTAGKGFSMTVNELSKTDGVTIPYLPQGPMSFVFSDTNSEAAVLAGVPGNLPPTVVSANGLVIVAGFGLQDGLTLRTDYAHHIEYIPRPAAAGLIATKVEPPSSVARDAISRGAQLVQQSLAGATSAGKVAGLVTNGGLAALQPLARAAVGMIPGASMALGAAKAASEALGAPAWLRSAIGFLA